MTWHPDIPLEYRNQIVTGDARELAKALPDESVDLIITSPPYNLGNSPSAKQHPTNGGSMASALRWKGYETFDDCLPEPEYQDWQVSILRELFRCLKDRASLCYQHCDRMIEGEVISPLFWLNRTPFRIRQQIIWDRGQTHRWDGFYFAPSHEYIFWLTKGRWDNDRRPQVRQWRSVWQIPPEVVEWHPAVFPVELALRCILALTAEYATVVDPFCGSGSSMVAAKLAGRNFIGFDISEKYVERARERVRNTNPPLFTLPPQQLELGA